MSDAARADAPVAPPPVVFWDQETLEAVLLGKDTSHGTVVVVDVRDDDARGGRIPGAVAAPSDEFDEHLPGLVSRYADADVLVFHCMFSQVRGPRCAKQFNHAVRRDNPDAKVRVAVLRGGFGDWVRKHLSAPGSKRAKLLADVDEEYWSSPYADM